MSRHLSFRLHFSNLTTASHRTHYHFYADVLWHHVSAHFLTSMRPMSGEQNLTQHNLKTVYRKWKSSAPDILLFPTYPSNSSKI